MFPLRHFDAFLMHWLVINMGVIKILFPSLSQAAEFRELWGPRSELRRFQDGGITEAVLWSGESVCERRLVPRQIVTHLLQL